MSAKAMKRLGIALIIIGVVCYTLTVVVWTAYMQSIINGDIKSTLLFFFLFILLIIMSTMGYGSIPLLIFAHRRKKREAKIQNTNTSTHCPYCGVKKAENSFYCIKCGNRVR